MIRVYKTLNCLIQGNGKEDLTIFLLISILENALAWKLLKLLFINLFSQAMVNGMGIYLRSIEKDGNP